MAIGSTVRQQAWWRVDAHPPSAYSGLRLKYGASSLLFQCGVDNNRIKRLRFMSATSHFFQAPRNASLRKFGVDRPRSSCSDQKNPTHSDGAPPSSGASITGSGGLSCPVSQRANTSRNTSC